MLPSHGQLYPSSTIRVLDAVAVVAIFWVASLVELEPELFLHKQREHCDRDSDDPTRSGCAGYLIEGVKATVQLSENFIPDLVHEENRCVICRTLSAMQLEILSTSLNRHCW